MWRAEGRSLYVLVSYRYGHGSTSSGGDHPRDLHRVVSHITIICRPYNEIGWVEKEKNEINKEKKQCRMQRIHLEMNQICMLTIEQVVRVDAAANEPGDK